MSASSNNSRTMASASDDRAGSRIAGMNLNKPRGDRTVS
jgi:hypothetical protein